MTRRLSLALLCFLSAVPALRADEFDDFVAPLWKSKCVRCHGGDEVNGKVNLGEIDSHSALLKSPVLIKEVIEVIDSNDMPPEGEPQLSAANRDRILSTLKQMLRTATAGESSDRLPIRRLNRFQYNNAVKDLFDLKLNVFALPEKLMTRQSPYIAAGAKKMPPRVLAASRTLNPVAGLRDVNAFPKDLRASHGFDNQANQLTLSPLLLDAFLKLSVSIVESPDFTPANVGIWNAFFREPPEAELSKELKLRLKRFLTRAFRGPVDSETLRRYVNYAEAKLNSGMAYAAVMKKVASAVLSSPVFLYQHNAGGDSSQLDLASRLSLFLWASSPDDELLHLAAGGRLSDEKALIATIDRMLVDPKIERFLDTFPAQWMQLENVLAATPDPRKQRFFSLDKSHPASLQMLVEPLLLFDAVFVENRPVPELISPEFAYQSEFLKTWYTSDLKAPRVDVARVEEENRRNEQLRKATQSELEKAQAKLKSLESPIRLKVLAARMIEADGKEPVDLRPYAAWEFDGDLKSSVGSFDLKANGKIEFKDGMVVLKRSYLQSGNIPIDLKAKTLEVWCLPHDLNQRGGGVMGIQGPGDFFDTIVLGERKPRHWISGSNGFSRTLDFPESTPEDRSDRLLHLVMVYDEDGTTRLYRNGVPYGKPYRKGSATFPKNRTSFLFGLRHLPAGGNKYLSVSIDKARFYNRALTAEEVATSSHGFSTYVTEKELLAEMTEPQREEKAALDAVIRGRKEALAKIPAPRDPKKLQQDAQRRFDDEIRRQLRVQEFQRVEATDPRYGGVITNAAMLSMTSGPRRTHPIARGAWIIEVILNDPPPPPPNDVPPLNEDQGDANLTIREKFAVHRENPDCAGCHSRLDPLGFALENFDITGRWRDKYENGRTVDSSGKLMRKHEFAGIVEFKQSLVREKKRFARAFTGHLLRFALARELNPGDSLTIDDIVEKAERDEFRLKSLIRLVILSDAFLGQSKSRGDR